MRLAVFTNQFPGKISTFFARDMRVLIDAGIEIEIFSFYPPEPTLWSYVPDILNERILPRNKVHHLSFSQSVRSLRPWPLKPFAKYLKDWATITASATKFGVGPISKSSFVFIKAWAWAKQCGGNFDHVLAYWGNYPATCAYVFHRLMGKEIPFSMFLHAGTDLYRDQVYLKEKLLYADNIITVCEFNREFIKKLYPDIFNRIADRIHIYHLGLNLEEFPIEAGNREGRKVLAVGSLNKRKGFDFLLRATHELKIQGFDIELELVGDGEDAEEFKALASKLQILDRVTFRGWLPFAEVRDVMKGACILVHPSSGLGDAVPTVIKESMALGTAVVASNVAGIPELLDYGRCGVLVPPKNVKALSEAIKAIMEDDALRNKYVSAAREYAELTFNLWRNGFQLKDLLVSTKRKVH